MFNINVKNLKKDGIFLSRYYIINISSQVYNTLNLNLIQTRYTWLDHYTMYLLKIQYDLSYLTL